MTLIFKSDVTYTGVAQARNILELLTTASEKTFFINKILSEIGYEDDYVTDATSANIVDRLLSHTKRVAELGAQVLSVPRTLKAILFVMKHGLLDTDYAAFSPDFGVRLDANGNMLFMYGLGIPKEMSILSGDAPAVKKTKLGYNSVSPTSQEIPSVIYSPLKMVASKGLILGQCYEQDELGQAKPLTLRSSTTHSDTISSNFYFSRSSNSVMVSFDVSTTAAIGGAYRKSLVVADSENFNNAGVVAKYEYGTVNNKLFTNGEVLINDSETATMFDLSTTSFSLSCTMGVLLQVKIIESWVINSKSDSVANALSVHLNRK